MRLFGLVGRSLDHSWSEEYFRQKFQNENITDSAYKNFPITDIHNSLFLVRNTPELEGLNITNPYKVEVMSYLDEISPDAASIGAVNCIKITRKEDKVLLYGYNTDAPAFRESLKPILKDDCHKALVLGNGGASRAIRHALKELKIDFKIVSRNNGRGDINFNDLDQQIIKEHQLIINATPAGMHPEPENFPPIPYTALTRGHLLYDLVYNPEETVFLAKGRQAGAQIKNGLEMLHLQAELSWQIWTK
jgi:shikimate dehydrogenase